MPSSTTPSVTPDGRTRDTVAAPALAWLLAGINVAAAAIHFAVVLEHRDGDLIVPLGFAAAAWFQLGTAAALVLRPPGRLPYGAAAIGNLAFIAVWIVSVTAGLPFDPYDGVAVDPGALELVATALEAGAVALATYLLLAPAHAWTLPAPALVVGVAVMTLTTTALVATDADAHRHGGDAANRAAAGGHAHGDAMGAAEHDDHAAQMLAIDRSRCDLAFNPASYWEEGRHAGVDTYGGGTMPADHGTGLASSATAPLAFDGRGSRQLDRLVSLTSLSGGEGAAARLVVELARASDEEYAAWRQWMAKEVNGAGGAHGHDGEDAGETGKAAGVPTMGHAGPQAWEAMVDPRLCDQLRDELELARKTALKYPTVADVTKAGWTRVTGYVPGIAAHFMNFSLVDDEFEIDKPEMILYDGDEPSSRVIGLSYYIRLDGDAPPTQGFTGPNDHTHRHFGLCVKGTGVIGDSTTTDEECEARGGFKVAGFDGWMSHAWVVPGCESPWGVFSAVNPLLDHELGQATGTTEGCAASSVRDRYALGPGTSDLTRGGDGGTPDGRAAGG